MEILWLIEHVAREMDVACAAKCIAEEKYGVDVSIRHIYLHTKELLKGPQPRVVVYPFFYVMTGLATHDYVLAWPGATHFNLAWEEIHYSAHEAAKRPGDEFTRNRVFHHAWGGFYKDFLLESGVPKEHIFVNGQPAYQLYRAPYSAYYKSRSRLAEEYGLDEARPWIFVPENYRWAFVTDSNIRHFCNMGCEHDVLADLRTFCSDSIKTLLKWCNRAALELDAEVIFRPRPATPAKMIHELFSEHVGGIPPRLRLTKDETVREWILASDLVVSSYSTTLIEAAIAGKPICSAEPIPIPDSLYCDFLQFVPRARTEDEFMGICRNPESAGDWRPLRDWAATLMLANGDPIEGLARYVAGLRQNGGGPRIRTVFDRLRDKMSRKAKHVPLKKKYFNEATHEKDVFDEELVRANVAEWKRVLFGGA